ncbi:WD40 repeat domain-containing protein [Sphingomonas alpina]|uniref:WD40 repeat domain-containing protein n=1 Tax=Sphingomonas alpina TaxID=653931 RepID=A0A7H0LFQ2_9SPHN|nr:hypothetical protein [Sphingomonas alpina]QNQ08505.1 hypothetical protein H3Z74_17380 [Sphingomonas alpina]
MQSSRKIGSFALAPDEEILIAGTLGGEVLVVHVDDFTVLERQRVHSGAIEAVAAHPTLPYVAAMSMDRSVSVFERQGPSLRLLDRFIFRDVPCRNDATVVPSAHSLSQALTFHPSEKRLAVRSGNAGVLELDFPDDRLTIRHCTRFHHDLDLVTLRYADADGSLISAAGGHAVLSRDGIELRSWDLGNFNLHWFEPLGDDEYLIACDELYVIRLDIRDRTEPLRGHHLTRDDLEHVTYNSTSQRAFAGGFDGTVYEIDPKTCDYRRIAWLAPYKMRWIKTLERAPDTLIAHCFNGGLYKVDLATQSVIATIKDTPNAVWTCLRDGDTLYFAGEGDTVGRVELGEPDPVTGRITVTPGTPIAKPPSNGSTYTKRMAMGVAGLLLAQKNGQLIEMGQDGARQICDVGEEVRDLAAVPGQPVAYVCTERGAVFRVDTASGDIVKAYQNRLREPIWSLAYHPLRDIIAFAERRGDIMLCDGNLKPLLSFGPTSRPKRMKWCGDTLIYVDTCELRRFDLLTQNVSDYVDNCGNTIEDFIWDESRRYLALVNYRTELVLCDFATGVKLSVVPDQPDFSKGLVWMTRPDGYPFDLATFGRSGTGHQFRIHNERCMAMGPIAPALIPALI